MSETKKAQSEVEALREKVAALEAAVAPMLRSWDGNEHVPYYGNGTAAQAIRDAISGGTAALEAHDAALLSRVRAAVEALPTYEGADYDSPYEDPDAWMVLRADVLAALDAKGVR